MKYLGTERDFIMNEMQSCGLGSGLKIFHVLLCLPEQVFASDGTDLRRFSSRNKLHIATCVGSLYAKFAVAVDILHT